MKGLFLYFKINGWINLKIVIKCNMYLHSKLINHVIKIVNMYMVTFRLL